jgi:repressor LexA
MTEAGIGDGALVLVRQQPTADNGDVVVALVDDEATIKELRRSADAVALVPRTKNAQHKPIVLRRDFQVQGVVVAALPDIAE